QAVMTHANVGAANALIGLIGAARMGIPLIFISGMTSSSERGSRGAPGHRDKLIHWSQDARDHAGIYRPYVKWEAELRDPSAIYDLLDRAHAIACTPPFGPVAISVSRDLLMSPVRSAFPPRPGVQAAQAPAPDPAALSTLLGWLRSAERPLVVTNRAGADPACARLLAEVAERHGIGVLTPEDFYASFPSDHPCHLGFKVGPALREADLVLVLDTDAPWFPLEEGPVDGARVVHVGPDPLFTSLPLRSHRGDLFMTTSLRAFLGALGAERPNEPVLPSRRQWIRSRKPEAPVPADRFDAEAVSSVLSEFLADGNTVLINELGLSPSALGRLQPGQYFRSGSASPLGWGAGCALGIAMADRSKTVIAALGDGVFYLSPALGTLLVSAERDAPILLLILNNGGMRSIAKSARAFYPATGSAPPLTRFYSEGIRIEKCAELVSGLGLRAGSANELRDGLATGLAFLREKRRPVVIDAVLSG
ncbi:MAG TPA: thiamine pyrophosphate-dependent enzyme, partial [Bdellovibrionota bacterium]|nr:thiamine pyrophosphate-dependent enzyme [Bdellovibrionota bacterium]